MTRVTVAAFVLAAVLAVATRTLAPRAAAVSFPSAAWPPRAAPEPARPASREGPAAPQVLTPNPFEEAGVGSLAVFARSVRDGSAMAGVRVDVVPFVAPVGARRALSVTTDERGVASFPRVPAGAVRIFGLGSVRAWAVESSVSDDVELRVDPAAAPAAARAETLGNDLVPAATGAGGGATVEGCARDEAGVPLARVVVSARAPGFRGRVAETATAADGAYRLEGLPSAIVSLRAGWLAGDPLVSSIDLRSSGPAVWDPRIATGRVVAGAIVDEKGAARPFARVCARAARDRAWLAETVADRSGLFEIGNAPDGVLVVEAEVARWPEGNAWVRETEASGAQRVTIVIPESARPSAFLSGRIVDAAGAPRGGVLVLGARLPRPAERPPAAFSQPDGRFRVGPVSPGVWILETPARSGTRAALAECTAAASEEVDVGDARVQGEGFLKVFLGGEARGQAGRQISVSDRFQRRVATLRPAAGFAASGPIAPGAYSLRVEAPGAEARETAFEVGEGATTALELASGPR